MSSRAFFTADGADFVPNPIAQGPWGHTLGGHIVGGLLARSLETAVTDPDLQPARLTVDLLRPIPMAPVRVRTKIEREGRRITLVDTVILQHDSVVSRASGLFLRRGDDPDGQVWSPPLAMPPIPPMPAVVRADLPMLLWSYGPDLDQPLPGVGADQWEQSHAQKFAWVRDIRSLIEGEPLTPFTRAAMAGEVTSSMTHWGTAGLRFINADYTMTLSRLPVGEYIGLAATAQFASAGVATGTATLFDAQGPIGTGVAVALGQPAGAFTPPSLGH
ncbi:thioesterase family protein [Mycolicibacterium komossense]|uniref:Thioesterase family protein n=1 Tax=Mycolicibacterium komossense TaxID=1779 RepID=A0ABT3C9S8_9MYCO|nr:thioesterase family protein [Mycolicibacterium komossense]MCV7226227.1 thioesterase family protein [Mycolicibacterium komossense]